MSKNQPPPRQPPRQPPHPDPVAAAAQKLGATVKVVPDANERLNKMWSEHIAPTFKDLRAKLDALQTQFTSSVYDQSTLNALHADISATEADLRRLDQASREINSELVGLELDDSRRALLEQAEDVTRRHRMSINNALDENGKPIYRNEPARADELAERLAKDADYKKIASALRGADIEIALKKAELESLDRERKTVSSLLWSQRARLENLTAQALLATPKGVKS